MICSFHNDASMDVMAGLQISQPCPVPYWAMTSSKVVSFFVLTRENSSVRVYGKCSHTWPLIVLPAACMAALNRSVTSGKQPPQPVPALVAAFTWPTEVRSWAWIAIQISPLVTLLQEQTCAVSGRLAAPPSPAAPPDLPMISSCGLQGRVSPLLASAESTP